MATVERYVILKGTGEVILGDTPPQRVKPFDVVLIVAGQPQAIRNLSSSEDLEFLCICTPGFRQENFMMLEK